MRTSAVATWLAAALALALHARPAQAGTLTVKASWSTPANVDLRVIGPTGRRYGPRRDYTRGPATEVCDIADATGRDYRAELKWSFRAAGSTTVTVEILRDGQLVSRNQVVLERRGDAKSVNLANPGAPVPPRKPAPPEKPPGLVVKASWRTAADIDLSVIDPAESKLGVQEDCLRGPGSEACVILRPRPGKHRIVLQVTSDRGAATTPVIVEVWRAGRLTNRDEVILGRRGDVKVVTPAAADEEQPEPAPGGKLTVTARWHTKADVDLQVVGPTGRTFSPARDLLRGPGHEVCTIPEITANNYGVVLTYVNARGLPATVVFVDVRVDGRLIRKVEHTLVKQGQVLRASTGWLAPPE